MAIAAVAHHFVSIGANRTSHIWSRHSTESHSRKQQGPPGFDGNTNTTCDSIREAVIKKGEQDAVSLLTPPHWGLAGRLAGSRALRGPAPGPVLQLWPELSQRRCTEGEDTGTGPQTPGRDLQVM